MNDFFLLSFSAILLFLVATFGLLIQKRKVNASARAIKGPKKNYENSGFFGYSSRYLIIIPIFFLFFCQIIVMLSWLLDREKLNTNDDILGVVLFLISVLLSFIIFGIFTKFKLEE